MSKPTGTSSESLLSVLPGGALSIPASEAGIALLNSLRVVVPHRRDYHENQLVVNRSRGPCEEAFCVLALLRHLASVRLHWFPAELHRAVAGGAPDFVLYRPALPPLAIEHTNAGGNAFQHWLGDEEHTPGVVHLPSPGGGGWTGDEPERAFQADLKDALCRKMPNKFWRNAPIGSVRCLMIYDQTNTGLFVEDEAARELLHGAIRCLPGSAVSFGSVVLVRAADRVMVEELR